MYQLRQRLSVAKTAPEINSLKRQIVATNKEIERLVYGLYGLTAEEIATVEGQAIATPNGENG